MKIDRPAFVSLAICLLILTTAFSYARGQEKEKTYTGEKVQFIESNNKIDVMIGDKHFTSYLYGDKLAKPCLFPLRSPSGIHVNRSYPLAKADGEEAKHPHHTGLFFAYRYVNDEDFWLNTNFGKDKTDKTQIKHIKVTQTAPGTGKGTLSTISHWIGKNGQVLLEEKKDMAFYASENEYIIDFDINLTAQDANVAFSDTKEGMFAIHVADWLSEAGSGEYLSSNGDRTEKNVWGKRARWVCLQGEKDGRTIGLAIFNHPKSINYPTYWHTRGYGLFSANPLGQFAYQKGRKLENPQPFNLILQTGQNALFKFRMIIYEGPGTKEQLEQQFKEFAK